MGYTDEEVQAIARKAGYRVREQFGAERVNTDTREAEPGALPLAPGQRETPHAPAAPFGTRSCADCGAEFVKRNAVHTYCDPCSDVRAAKRRQAWSERNPDWQRDPERLAEQQSAAAARKVENGIAISERARSTIADPFGVVDLAWYIRIKIPFTYAISKNALYGQGISRRVFMRSESKAVRDQIVRELREAGLRERVKNYKLWIDFLVQKPDHRGDAVNVVDVACDAIKIAAGLDDRWYSIRRLDWEVVKRSPSLFIGIGQEECVDSQVCTTCGRTLPFAHFTRKRGATNGVDRYCRECRGNASMELGL